MSEDSNGESIAYQERGIKNKIRAKNKRRTKNKRRKIKIGIKKKRAVKVVIKENGRVNIERESKYLKSKIITS